MGNTINRKFICRGSNLRSWCCPLRVRSAECAGPSVTWESHGDHTPSTQKQPQELRRKKANKRIRRRNALVKGESNTLDIPRGGESIAAE
eukprot:3310898-Amphidinium_carterae.1